MHLLYCDETNLEERSGDFLIYGGLMIDGDEAHGLSLAIDDLRNRYDVPRDYRLKFNPPPEGFDHQRFIALKQEVMEIMATFGTCLIVYVILHDVASDPDTARRNGINIVSYHFDCLLSRFRKPGLVLIDRFNDAGNAIEAYLRDKFLIGLTDMPYSSTRRLRNIIGFHYSAVGQSHFPSLVDISLGSLRFAINSHTRKQDKDYQTARALLRLLSPLFWRQPHEEQISELSLIFSPKAVRNDHFRSKYDALKRFLEKGGIPTAQQITDQRTY